MSAKGRKQAKDTQGAGIPVNGRKALNPRQRRLVRLYTDPSNRKTFGNKTQSALQAGYTENVSSAKTIGSRLFTNVDIKSEVERVLEEQNLGMEVRAKVLKDVLSQKTTDILQYDGEGVLRSKTRMSNDKMRLASVRELNKMSGVYERSAALGRAAGKALEPLVDEWTRKLRAEINRGHELSEDSIAAEEGAPAEVEEIIEQEGEGNVNR